MLTVGLTGNYGMGKSTVASIFKELGAIIIDTDILVRELLQKKDVIEEIKEAFGDDIVIGNEINKNLLAQIVFENPSKRIQLENIIHPKLFKIIDIKIKEIDSSEKGKIVIIEAPLIFERGYQNRFDTIITVYTSEETAIERLRKKGVSEEEARKRLANQFPIHLKISRSDFAIDNGKSIEITKKQVENIYKELLILEERYR